MFVARPGIGTFVFCAEPTSAGNPYDNYNTTWSSQSLNFNKTNCLGWAVVKDYGSTTIKNLSARWVAVLVYPKSSIYIIL